ncbi:3-beta-hydroxysteroid dehydrogenase [Luminiphilus syltensis NOR5-1B]|uniref:3-beta-hydroxysteroid dehydrogenase n=2 Tax=Luminiphilus TaxID=1341118 RepID=B8KXP3_9GAMM|nr:3-beta-hydroxysteroid dehydrogenase [Luminiphilus syltensis NOR5-1B]
MGIFKRIFSGELTLANVVYKITVYRDSVMGRVAGKVVIITGGASGLGAADARLLSGEGARVVLTDVDRERGEALAAELEGALFIEHDVRDEAAWQHVIATTVERLGGLDVLVNNAGLVKFGSVEETTLEEYRLLNSVMSEGTFLGCKYAVPAMAQSGGGSIINISSVAALKGVGAIVAYTAAKGAIRAMTRSVAVHCQERKYNIRCNVVLPGAHDTPMTRAALAELPSEEEGLNQIQQHGQGRPEDVARLVLFLASEESCHITGSELVIDNGETMR